MKSRRALLAATVAAGALVRSAGSAFASPSGGDSGARVYHCDALTGGSVPGSASVKFVNGSPDPTSVHGNPACVTEVVSIITGGF